MTDVQDCLPGAKLESRVAQVGETLAARIADVVAAIPGGPRGPADLARTIGVDKVLASRILKAAGSRDPIAVLHTAPGPEPMRRLLLAAKKSGVPARLILAAREAVDAFDTLVRREAGDRSTLDAMISAWLPEARAEFELRRKQAAFRAMSQLRGVAADVDLATVLLHPSADNEHWDVVWLFGLLGLQRFRPLAPIKLSSRRTGNGDAPRHPETLDGVAVEGLDGLRLNDYCTVPSVNVDVHHVGDVVHYMVADNGFGPQSATDLVFAEVNRAELPRIPVQPEKRQTVFAEVAIPFKVLMFDALLHEDVFPGVEPELIIYDTAFDGIASANDPARDIDQLDMCESIQPLGWDIAKFRAAEVPRYAELLRHVCSKLNWDGTRFRGYRCRIEYPLYGSQVLMAF